MNTDEVILPNTASNVYLSSVPVNHPQTHPEVFHPLPNFSDGLHHVTLFPNHSSSVIKGNNQYNIIPSRHRIITSVSSSHAHKRSRSLSPPSSLRDTISSGSSTLLVPSVIRRTSSSMISKEQSTSMKHDTKYTSIGTPLSILSDASIISHTNIPEGIHSSNSFNKLLSVQNGDPNTLVPRRRRENVPTMGTDLPSLNTVKNNSNHTISVSKGTHLSINTSDDGIDDQNNQLIHNNGKEKSSSTLFSTTTTSLRINTPGATEGDHHSSESIPLSTYNHQSPWYSHTAPAILSGTFWDSSNEPTDNNNNKNSSSSPVVTSPVGGEKTFPVFSFVPPSEPPKPSDLPQIITNNLPYTNNTAKRLRIFHLHENENTSTTTTETHKDHHHPESTVITVPPSEIILYNPKYKDNLQSSDNTSNSSSSSTNPLLSVLDESDGPVTDPSSTLNTSEGHHFTTDTETASSVDSHHTLDSNGTHPDSDQEIGLSNYDDIVLDNEWSSLPDHEQINHASAESETKIIFSEKNSKHDTSSIVDPSTFPTISLVPFPSLLSLTTNPGSFGTPLLPLHVRFRFDTKPHDGPLPLNAAFDRLVWNFCTGKLTSSMIFPIPEIGPIMDTFTPSILFHSFTNITNGNHFEPGNTTLILHAMEGRRNGILSGLGVPVEILHNPTVSGITNTAGNTSPFIPSSSSNQSSAAVVTTISSSSSSVSSTVPLPARQQEYRSVFERAPTPRPSRRLPGRETDSSDNDDTHENIGNDNTESMDIDETKNPSILTTESRTPLSTTSSSAFTPIIGKRIIPSVISPLSSTSQSLTSTRTTGSVSSNTMLPSPSATVSIHEQVYDLGHTIGINAVDYWLKACPNDEVRTKQVHEIRNRLTNDLAKGSIVDIPITIPRERLMTIVPPRNLLDTVATIYHAQRYADADTLLLRGMLVLAEGLEYRLSQLTDISSGNDALDNHSDTSDEEELIETLDNEFTMDMNINSSSLSSSVSSSSVTSSLNTHTNASTTVTNTTTTVAEGTDTSGSYRRIANYTADDLAIDEDDDDSIDKKDSEVSLLNSSYMNQSSNVTSLSSGTEDTGLQNILDAIDEEYLQPYHSFPDDEEESEKEAENTLMDPMVQEQLDALAVDPAAEAAAEAYRMKRKSCSVPVLRGGGGTSAKLGSQHAQLAHQLVLLLRHTVKAYPVHSNK